MKTRLKTLSMLSAAALSLTILLSACSPSTAAQTQPTTAAVQSQAQPTKASPAATATPAAADKPAAATATPAAADKPTAADQSASTSAARVNLNTATQEQLLAIPNMSSRMVKEFMEYRPYSSIAQFEKEIGKYIDASQVKAYEPYVFVPIVVNKADKATLMQISGLDASEAEALIAARPYADNAAFLDALSKSVSAAELEAAKALLSN